MPSPFPGMDPYLEAPAIWPDFHQAFATEIRNELNRTLTAPYYARLEMRPEVGIASEAGGRQRIVPDVVVVHTPHAEKSTGGTAVLDHPRVEVSKSVQITVSGEPLRHHFVEIRDAAQGHKLITVIEILSPSNKRAGPDRDAYQRKQCEVLQSDASLVELDLLRGGRRVLPNPELAAVLDQLDPPAHYLVLVTRSWQRSGQAMDCQCFPVSLREWLPCIPIPLSKEDAEVPLDLQFLFNRAYEGGPYQRGAVNYEEPPEPPLPAGEAQWGAQLVQCWLASRR